ncbi:MAG: polyphosphate kinase 2 family protein, partial [Actinobacteria bacterium]|nr:polyphosphate kinase 2 family protein [Actinomycetota bacterium]
MANDPVKSLKVAPGSKVRLRSFDTGDTFGWHKESAVAELEQVKLRLEVVQQRLFGEERRSLLLVLQAMDAAGKDGTIRSIFSGMNPAGVTVSNFGVPSDEDAAHDYLWRAHAHTPAKGRIGVFNRSYYEDLLVVRVKGFVPRPVWSKRFDHINA